MAALQQPLLQGDTSDWGRPLLVDPSGVQDQRSIFPVDLPDVYDSVSVVDHWSNGKRNGAIATSHKPAHFTLQVKERALFNDKHALLLTIIHHNICNGIKSSYYCCETIIKLLFCIMVDFVTVEM